MRHKGEDENRSQDHLKSKEKLLPIELSLTLILNISHKIIMDSLSKPHIHSEVT